MSLQDELEKYGSLDLDGVPEEESNRVTVNLNKLTDKLKNDFQQIKPQMTECRFRMDISFLVLLINSMKEKGHLNEEDQQAYDEFRKALDKIFNDMIQRNFQRFDADPEYFIFRHNQNDKALFRELSTPTKNNRGPRNLN